MREVPPHIQRFIEAYVSNPTKSKEEFAKEFDVNRQTIYNWIADYKEEISSISNEIQEAVIKRLKSLAIKATNKLEDLLDASSTFLTKSGEVCESDNLNVQLGSAKAIIENAIPKRSESEVTMKGNPILIVEDELPKVGG